VLFQEPTGAAKTGAYFCQACADRHRQSALSFPNRDLQVCAKLGPMRNARTIESGEPGEQDNGRSSANNAIR
jgi:hypothetical protein